VRAELLHDAVNLDELQLLLLNRLAKFLLVLDGAVVALFDGLADSLRDQPDLLLETAEIPLVGPVGLVGRSELFLDPRKPGPLPVAGENELLDMLPAAGSADLEDPLDFLPGDGPILLVFGPAEKDVVGRPAEQLVEVLELRRGEVAALFGAKPVYLHWFVEKGDGFPNGRLGELMEFVYRTKGDGAEVILHACAGPSPLEHRSFVLRIDVDDRGRLVDFRSRNHVSNGNSDKSPGDQQGEPEPPPNHRNETPRIKGREPREQRLGSSRSGRTWAKLVHSRESDAEERNGLKAEKIEFMILAKFNFYQVLCGKYHISPIE